MTEQCEQPYMKKLLANLGWDQGTRIPLASPENQALETLLIDRQNEIQRLKEELTCHKEKRQDLDKYKLTVHTEEQENTRILFAQKHQLEQEVKLRQLALTEAELAERDIQACHKKSKELATHNDRHSVAIAKLLKRADDLKNEVCAEKGALTEWRALIERGAGDIAAIEQFTKQDQAKAKNLEVQRQKLKVEHDRMQERLTQMVNQISAEERGCERASRQVAEGIRERQKMMAMWQSSVENLHQRDDDIRHMREDYLILEQELNNMVELCREQQNFFDQQRRNNLEAEREVKNMTVRLGQLRIMIQQEAANNVHLESEMKSLQRELANLNHNVEKLRAENRSLMEQQRKADATLSDLNQKIRELKVKAIESLDKSKSAEKRAKQLEDMLNEEEQYATALTQNQQRAMHCSFIEQQKLLELKNEEKLFHMAMKESDAVMSKLDTKRIEMEKKHQALKETLYALCYQVETVGAKVMHMEGGLADREANAELAAKENRLKNVLGLHSARVALLERHSTKLYDDMRRLVREIEVKSVKHDEMQSFLKSSILGVHGGNKELKEMKEAWRRDRVEESLVKLRVAHAARAVANIENAAFTLEKQRFQIDAAMNERMAEIAARRDMFATQKRALVEDCSRLRGEIKEREMRVQQLIKRYEIFIASLGKEDSDSHVAIAFFKIKFAAERAELREKGAALDADIGRREKDVSALEATMRVIACAHSHFTHNVSALGEDTPEMEEVRQLTEKYYALRDELKVVRADVSDLEIRVSQLRDRLDLLEDKNKQLMSREAEAEAEVEAAKERVAKQEARLHNARDVVRQYFKRAKKLIDGIDDWRIFQLAIWLQDLSEACSNAMYALNEVCGTPNEVHSRFAALLSLANIHHLLGPRERPLVHLVDHIIGAKTSQVAHKKFSFSRDDSVFSSSMDSARSVSTEASGFTKRFTHFRKIVSHKLQEPAIDKKETLCRISNLQGDPQYKDAKQIIL